MGRLLRFELQKIFSKKLLYVLLVVFIAAANAYLIVPMITSGSLRPNRFEPLENFYKKYGGELTEDKYRFIIEEYNEAEGYFFEHEEETDDTPGQFADTRKGDYYLLSSVKTEMEYIAAYSDAQRDIVARAGENVSLFQKRGDRFEVLRNRQIIKYYDVKPALKLMDAGGWSHLGYNSYVFFVLILLILFVGPVFSDEREQNMYPVIRSTKRGGTRVACAKIISAAVFSVFVCVCFAVAGLGIRWLYGDLYGFGNYIQNLSDYQYCPFNLTFLSYFFAHTAMICLGAVCVAMMMCLISVLCKNSILSMALCALLVAALYGYLFYSNYLPSITQMGLGAMFEPEFLRYLDFNEKYLVTGLFEPQRYFTGFHVVNFAGRPVVTVIFNVCFTAVKCAVLSGAVLLLYAKPKFRLRGTHGD